MVSYQQTASVRSDMATQVGQNMEDCMDVASEYNVADNMDNSKFGKNNMTNDIKVGQNMEDEMDKLLEEFLMPPPEGTPRSFVLRNSLESLRDVSSTSLDKSGNSSSTTGSWNSSCSCHSMSSLSQSKSAFVFHKQAILPPLLCSSSRTEMKVYKMKAVEREQRRKDKEKQRLISRVEAILSSVEVSPMKNKKPLIQLPIKESHTISVQPIEIPQDHCKQLDNATDTNSDRDLQNVSDVISSCHDKQCSDDETMQSEDDITHKQNLSNCDITEQNNSHENDLANYHYNNDTADSENTSDHHSDSDDVASSDDNAAYRSSLRNLLQKSMNLSQSGIVNSPSQSKTEKVENIEQESATSTKSSSESDADITENTVVEMKTKEDKILGQNEKNDKNTPNFASNVLKTEEATQHDSNFVPESENLSQEDILVESIVQTALIGAKNQLDNENSMKPLSPNNDNCDVDNDSILFLNNQLNDLIKQNEKIIPRVEKTDILPPKDISDEISSWETPKITKISEKPEISPLSVTDSQFFELHNQSTSTKVNYPLDGVGEQISDGGLETPNYSNKIKIDSSPILPNETEITNHNEIVELQGEFCYKSTIIEACPVAEETVSEVQHNCDDDTITDGLTVLKPVMSDTVSDVTMTIYDETMKENCDPTMETGSLFSIKRSLSFTLDQPSPEFESAVIEAVSQHFHGNKDEEMMNKHSLDAVGPVLGIDSNAPRDEIAVAKRKMMLQQRVRRGSYTLEEPSPYLVKNKENLMIAPDNFDNDFCSETMTTSTGDVKRKLDLPSDSEESSISVKRQRSKVMKGNVSKAELHVANLCRVLQDQHKQQMNEMKRKHQEQLMNIQKEIIQKPKDMSLPLEDVMSKPYQPHDVTVSPSLASTEYKEIRLQPRSNIEVQTPYEPHATSAAGEYPTQYYSEDPSVVSERFNHYDAIEYQNDANFTRFSEVQVTPTLHDKFCKLSALCKGHLTRQLLGSNKVQEILQIIRDTSRLILSLRMEESNEKKESTESEGKTENGMNPVRDEYLENRLYNQLRSAIYQLHNIFFNVSTKERMYIIAQSCLLARSAEKKNHKPNQLSIATQKSLERKRLLSSNSDGSSHPVANHVKTHHKDIKSKISHIWKTEPVKLPEKKSPIMPKVTSQSKNQKPIVTSQNRAKSHVTTQAKPVKQGKKVSSPTSSGTAESKSKSPVTSQSRSMTSQQGRKPTTSMSSITSQSKPKSSVKSPTKKVMSQTTNVTSQTNTRVTSQRLNNTQNNNKVMSQNNKPMSRKTVQNRKPVPLSSRGNLRGHV
ncbi:uncharacterized protein LOC120332775 [Styela clava]